MKINIVEEVMLGNEKGQIQMEDGKTHLQRQVTSIFGTTILEISLDEWEEIKQTIDKLIQKTNAVEELLNNDCLS